MPDVIPASATLPLLLLEGRWAEARASATALHASRAGGWSRLVANAALAFIARETGDPARAWAHATEDLADGPATEPGDVWLLDALPVQRLAAAIAADRGDLVAARAWLACHDRWLAWSGGVLGRAEGQLGWAAYHRATGDLARAREHAELALTHASAPRQPLALLAARRTLGELDTAEDRHIDARGHLAEALALADACAAPYERALTLLILAELCIATDDRETSRAALSEARGLLKPLRASPALARADTLTARLDAAPAARNPGLSFGLTAREAEVLTLLAAGLTDPQIAARLFVSRHTVNDHLKAIYGKLAVTNRAAATRLALTHRLA